MPLLGEPGSEFGIPGNVGVSAGTVGVDGAGCGVVTTDPPPAAAGVPSKILRNSLPERVVLLRMYCRADSKS